MTQTVYFVSNGQEYSDFKIYGAVLCDDSEKDKIPDLIKKGEALQTKACEEWRKLPPEERKKAEYPFDCGPHLKVAIEEAGMVWFGYRDDFEVL